MQKAPLIHDPWVTRRRFLGLTAASLAGSGLLESGFRPQSSRAAVTPRRGGVLRLGHTKDVVSFDGPTVSDNASIWTMLLIYDQLTRPTTDGLSVEGSLAHSWDIS